MLKTNHIEKLWKQYEKTRSAQIREQLILEYAPLVKYVAGRVNIYLGKNVEYDDLVSYGIFGLIDAIEKFDLKKGVKFETYASLRIRGAIIDSIRERDWIPRSLRQKQKDLEKSYNTLESALGRPATDQEMARHLQITVEEFHQLLAQVNIASLMSLDEFLEQNAGGSIFQIDGKTTELPENEMEKNELKDLLTDTIDSLPEKEKKVVFLYYFEDLTLKEISKIMGVSESRISQLHSKALVRMKGKLNKHRNFIEH